MAIFAVVFGEQGVLFTLALTLERRSCDGGPLINIPGRPYSDPVGNRTAG